MATSIYTGFARQSGDFPTGGSVGDVLTLDAGLAPVWSAGTPGPPGGSLTFWPAPFVSSNGVLLDDARGAVGDEIHDGDYVYKKETDSPDLWYVQAVGTVVPT